MKHTPEEIKNRLSNIGEAIGNIALDYITDLEKENAEYKEVFGSCGTCKRSCDIGNCCDPRTKSSYLLDKVKVIVERQKLLKENTELKELLKQWVELYKPKLEGYPITPIQEQTEQFLSEVEK